MLQGTNKSCSEIDNEQRRFSKRKIFTVIFYFTLFIFHATCDTPYTRIYLLHRGFSVRGRRALNELISSDVETPVKEVAHK